MQLLKVPLRASISHKPLRACESALRTHHRCLHIAVEAIRRKRVVAALIEEYVHTQMVAPTTDAPLARPVVQNIWCLSSTGRQSESGRYCVGLPEPEE